ncbi:MAG: hypothetical protein R3F14_09950 [Polyangiaceae bacterium]
MKRISAVGATLTILMLWGCQEIDGECWLVSEDGPGAGVGGGPIVPGSGGYGDVPPAPQSTGDSPPGCGDVQGFSSSLFKFKTTQADDGVGFGWQVAEPTLKFADGRQDPTQYWSCTLNVGMPLRTEKLGKISAEWAAETSSEVATSASSNVMHSKSSWTVAAFCKAFKDEMNRLFKIGHEGLGARVELVSSGQ